MENFAPLGSLLLRLHEEFVHLYYLALPVFFMLAIAIDWMRDPGGTPDFLGTLKRAVISTLLVAGFQEIADLILALTSGVADRISDLSGIDAFYAMALQKIKSYHFGPVVSVLMGANDLALALLSFASYVLVYWARYVVIAIYHFMWTFLCILGPVLILFNLFRGTTQVTINLFKGLIEVASYKIVWAILSAMLTSLAFGQAYQADGGYLTVIVLNFVIALALLATPLLVHSLIGSGVTSLGQTLATGAVTAVISAPSKMTKGVSFSLDAIGNPKGFAKHIQEQFKPKGRFDYTAPPPTSPKPDYSYAQTYPSQPSPPSSEGRSFLKTPRM
jgi:hypothetical protein